MTVTNERLDELIQGYAIWGKTNSAQPQIDLDTAEALTELRSLRTQTAGEAVAWTDQDGLNYLKQGHGIDVSTTKGAMGRTVPLFTHPKPVEVGAIEAATNGDELVERLKDTAAQLRRMAEIATFGGDATGVRVKDPSLLLADLDEAAARILALTAALGNMPCPRPCNHRPDEFDAKDCVAAGESGCGAAILARKALSTLSEQET